MKEKVFLLYEFTDQYQLTQQLNPISGSRILEVSPFNIVWTKRIFECGGGIDILKILLLAFIEIILFVGYKERVKFFIFIVKDRIAHYSVVQVARYHLSRMKSQEKEIGFCYTHEDFRGKGIYPFVLASILKKLTEKVFMIVHKDNNSSIKGIEKVGFQFSCSLERVKTIYFYPRYL